MLYADPSEGDEAPNHQCVENAGDRPVADDARLQENFYESAPEPLPEGGRRKFPRLGELREEPLVQRFVREPEASCTQRQKSCLLRGLAFENCTNEDRD